MKYININGVDFELANKELSFYGTINTFHTDGVTVSDVYGRPSATKLAIEDEWIRWFNELPKTPSWQYDYKFGVRSHNCNFFTLHGIISWENEWYYISISHAHNRAYKLV